MIEVLREQCTTRRDRTLDLLYANAKEAYSATVYNCVNSMADYKELQN